MTLRLSDEDDTALTALAASEGVSKQEAAVRAIREKAAAVTHDAEVRRLTRKAVQRYGPLLDRFAQ